jgi:hypothetical protein
MVFKRFESNDINIYPYVVNKSWSFNYNNLNPEVISIYEGTSSSFSLNGLTESISTTGRYESLIYHSIKHLYYSNFLSGSFEESGSFYNYNQSNYKNIKSFPTSSNSMIRLFSVSRKIFGDRIKPGSLTLKGPNKTFYDDKEGNIYFTSGSQDYYIGNIFYSHGIITTLDQNEWDVYSGSATWSFQNEHTIYEHQYRCVVTEDDFIFSQNPTIMSDSSGSIRGFATSSYFSPYVTTIGLYNDSNDLIAIGKLSKPVPLSQTSDTNFVIKFDT